MEYVVQFSVKNHLDFAKKLHKNIEIFVKFWKVSFESSSKAKIYYCLYVWICQSVP